MSNTQATSVRAAAATTRKGKFRTKLSRFFLWFPGFAYLLVLYIIVEISVTDVRAVIISVSTYAVAWVDVFYTIAIIMAMSELVRFSKPRRRNTKTVLGFAVVSVLYIILFVIEAVLAVAGMNGWGIFFNTEFFILMCASVTQWVTGYLLNSRILQMTLTRGDESGYGGGYDHDHDAYDNDH